MKTRILILLIITYIISGTDCFAGGNGPETLSLTEAIQMAVTNQPLIRQAEAQVNAAEAKIKQSDSYYYPVVEGNLSYTRIGPLPSFNFGGENLYLAPANNYNMNVSASQLLYDFGKRDAIMELSKSYKISSEDKISFIKNDFAYRTVAVFYSILFLEKSIGVKNKEIAALKKHIELTTRKVESGSATDFDILTTRVKLASVENEKIDMMNSLKKAKINIAGLLGIDNAEDLILEGNFDKSLQTIDTEILVGEAFNTRQEIILAKDAEKSAELNKSFSVLGDKPMLNLFASYGLKNGFEPNLDVLRGNWTAGVSAKLPIFNGNLNDAKVEEAEAELKNSSEKIPELKRKIKVEVEKAVADYNSNLAKLDAVRLQIEQAKQAVSRAEISYRDGVITNLDLIDAETNLSEAELQFVRIQYQNVLNSYEVEKAVGNKLW